MCKKGCAEFTIVYRKIQLKNKQDVKVIQIFSVFESEERVKINTYLGWVLGHGPVDKAPGRCKVALGSNPRPITPKMGSFKVDQRPTGGPTKIRGWIAPRKSSWTSPAKTLKKRVRRGLVDSALDCCAGFDSPARHLLQEAQRRWNKFKRVHQIIKLFSPNFSCKTTKILRHSPSNILCLNTHLRALRK